MRALCAGRKAQHMPPVGGLARPAPAGERLSTVTRGKHGQREFAAPRCSILGSARGLADLGSSRPTRDERARWYASRRPLARGRSKSRIALIGAVADQLIARLYRARSGRGSVITTRSQTLKNATRLKTGFRVKGSYAREGGGHRGSTVFTFFLYDLRSSPAVWIWALRPSGFDLSTVLISTP